MIKVKGLFLFQILLATCLIPKSDKVCQTLGEVEIRIDTEKQKCPPFLHPVDYFDFIINLFTIHYINLKPLSGNSSGQGASFLRYSYLMIFRTGSSKASSGTEGSVCGMRYQRTVQSSCSPGARIV